MAKRFISSEIWDEDWFLDMPIEYKLFWHYIILNCDHAGIFKVNLRSFCGLNNVELDKNTALTYFNKNKDRIRVLSENLWLIEDFFAFQYGGTFNANNRVHDSIKKIYTKHGVKLTSIRGLIDLKDGVKDKDKDKEREFKDSNYPERVKGGFGGKKFDTTNGQAPKAVKVDEKFAYFGDGSKQPLGEVQRQYLENGVYKPNDIAKTLIF